MSNAFPEFGPSASWEMLRLRAELLETVRQFFRARGSLEVETPIVSRDVVVDAHLDPFVTEYRVGNRAETFYLQTSPEFHMKRLLAAGGKSLFQIARVMRHGEYGQRHNPEYTMVEWYQVGDDHHDQMDCVESLVKDVLQRSGELCGVVPIPESAFERLSYDEAFERLAGDRVLKKSAVELAAMAQKHGIEPPPGHDPDDCDAWLNLLLAFLVEPHLGESRPTFLYDYPASQSALAKVRNDDPPVAERFELYIAGVELCNGYHELTDANELRRRIAIQAAIRRREGHRQLPAESRLLTAMEAGLPDCAGVALGFDRLVMIAAGRTTLADVLAFPFDRA